MIPGTMTEAMPLAGVQPGTRGRTHGAGRGDGAFEEALAGAHTVHDREQSRAVVGREHRSDRANERANDAHDKHDVDAVEADRSAEADTAEAGATSGDTAVEAGGEQVTDGTTPATAAVPAVAAAPAQAEDGIVVLPTVTTTTQVTSDAVDAAMRLAIGEEPAAAVAVAAAVADEAEAAVVTQAARGAEDVEAGDGEEGATSPISLLAKSASGPSPVQQAAQQAAQQAGATPVAAAAVQQVAEGEGAAAAQVVQAAVQAETKGAATAASAVATDADAETIEVDVDAPDVATANRAQPQPVANHQAAALAARAQAEAAEEAGGEAAAAPKPAEAAPGQVMQPVPPARGEGVAPGLAARELGQAQGMQHRIDHIAEQLATRLRLSQAAGGSQVQLSLRPRELGEVIVQMNVREGVVAATVLVDRADTVRLLQTNIEDLKRSLEQQGLSIQEFSVDVRGDAGTNGANSDRAQHRSGGAASGTATGAAGDADNPGLTGDHAVDPDDLHDGTVSVLA